MAVLIERLYANTPKEISAGLIVQERYIERVAGTPAAATSIQVFFSAIPSGILRVITAIGIVSQPGAAQTTLGTIFQIAINNQAQFQLGVSPTRTPAAAVVDYLGASMGEGVICRPGDSISVTGFFSGGAAANNIIAYLAGYQIPTGNVF